MGNPEHFRIGGISMKAGTTSTQLSIVRTRQKVQSGRQISDEHHTPSWSKQVTGAEDQAAIKRGLRTSRQWSEDRAARVEALRAQVRAGTYVVDSAAVARKMLKKETHYIRDGL
jgi:flagellar biosynthesis anti-sigma factor FlgM